MLWLLILLISLWCDVSLSHIFHNGVSQTDSPPVVFSSKVNHFSQKVGSIPGTGLFSGLPYKISIKRYPGGVITWTNQTDSNNANFVILDLDPDVSKVYGEGGEREIDASWILHPTGEQNYFTIQNTGLSLLTHSESFLTWNTEQADQGGYHVVCFSGKHGMDHFKDKNGNWKDKVLWKVVDTGNNQYKLINRGMESATFTWTDKLYGEYSYYMQLDADLSDAKSYKRGGEWFKDETIIFTPVRLKAKDKIYTINEYERD